MISGALEIIYGVDAGLVNPLLLPASQGPGKCGYIVIAYEDTPGVFDIRPKLTLLEAILMAGGFNRGSAEMSTVLIIRGPPEKQMVFKLNLKKLITKGDQSDNIYVKPGDFVYVPMTMISNVESFVGSITKYLTMWYGFGGGQPFTAGGTWNWGTGGAKVGGYGGGGQ